MENLGLTIDLGSLRSVNQVSFHPHQDSWATVYDVLVSVDNTNWVTVGEQTSGQAGILAEFHFDPIVAQYVKFDVKEVGHPGNWGHAVSEVLVVSSNSALYELVSLNNSSLASQSVGPPTSDFEMICSNRKFAEMGRKLISRNPLKFQEVSIEDSVLGSIVDASGKINITYSDLIKEAFHNEWWSSSITFDGFTQMEANFSLIWGIALQLYQATLVSDQAPYDFFAAGQTVSFDPALGNQNVLTQAQKQGLDVFLNKGKCINCHQGPVFSNAAPVPAPQVPVALPIERMIMNDGGTALYDVGFYNIGVTPTDEDLGVGGIDPFGNPLSFTSQFVNGHIVDSLGNPNPCNFEEPFDVNNCAHIPENLVNERQAVRGAFKVPSLRNVELTGPYMHNGSMSTLEQVVNFYNRGGNFQNAELDPDIELLGLTEQEKSDLVEFLKSLTDPRVANAQEPFDHPQLFIPNGHPGDEHDVSSADGLRANDTLIEIQAVGRNGRLTPLKPFADNLN